MTRWQLIKSMTKLARELITETKEAGEWRGTPKQRSLALIRQYWAINDCTQCDTHPEQSCSHKIFALIQRQGIAIASITLFMAAMGGRDTYGWRKGGI